jgi:hypothetical protein
MRRTYQETRVDSGRARARTGMSTMGQSLHTKEIDGLNANTDLKMEISPLKNMNLLKFLYRDKLLD